MNTTYKPRVNYPIQVVGTNAFNTMDKNHPIHQEIQKVIGKHNFQATFAIDTETLDKFKNIPGLVGIICNLEKDGRPISEGRGVAVMSKINRSIERTVGFTFRSAFLDAVMRYSRVMDALETNSEIKQDGLINLDELFKDDNEVIPMTERQESYLLELIQSKVYKNEDRNKWKDEIKNYSKEEASASIQVLLNKN